MDSKVADETGSDLLDSSAAGPRAIRGSAWRIAGYVAGLLIGVVATALLFRHLGRRETGSYVAVTSLVAIVAGLSDLGLTAIGVRELAVRRGDHRRQFARNLLGLRIVTTTVGVAAVAAFAAVAGYGTTLVIGVVFAGVGLLVQTCQSMLTVSLLVDLRPAWVAAFDFLRATLTAALIIALVVVGAHLLSFLAVTIPVGVVVLAANAWLTRGRMPLVPAFNAAEWRHIMRGALPYALATAAASLYSQAAVVIVSLLANKNALGDFGLSARAVQLLLVLPGLVVGTALPIFARAARDDRVRLGYALSRTFEVCFLVGVWVALALGVGAPLAVVIFGPQFRHAVPLLAIQGSGLGASFVGAVWANGLLSMQRYRAILAINVLALVAGTSLIVALVSIDGARGAAIATAFWELVVVVLSGMALVRADRRLMPPLGIVPKVAAAAGVAVLTTLLALPVLVSVVAASLVYLAVVVALGAVPREVFHLVRPPRH